MSLTGTLKWRLLRITALTTRPLLSRGILPMLPSPRRVMDSLHSKAMASRIMDHMPNLLPLLLIAVTVRPHLQLEVTRNSSNSMDPDRTVNQHQLAILLPSLLLTAIHSQPRVMEPAAMTVLLLLLLQLPPSLMALSQGTQLSLPTLVMANRLLPLHLRVTMLTVSQLLITRIATPSQQHMVSNSLDTRASRRVTTSNRATNSRPRHSNRLLLLTLLRLVGRMGSLQPTSTTSKADHPVTTSPAITVITDRMGRVVVLVIQALSLRGTLG